MLELQYGEVRRVIGSEVAVSLPGYARDVEVVVKLLQPAGSSSVQTWIPPQAGDCVAVLVDTERPECAVLLGGVYTDRRPPVASGAVIALQAPSVRLGSDVSSAGKVPRDDHVQAELAAIKSALDSLVSQLNEHTHPIPDGATAIPEVPMSHGYAVGSTASDSVYVK